MPSSFMIIPNSSSRLSRLSPDGVYLASVSSKTKLTVYKRKGNDGVVNKSDHNVDELLSPEFIVCSIFTCQDNVDYIQWSPDSELVFAAQLKSAIVQVYSPDQPEFRCKITEGVAGLSHAAWAPDSRHLLTHADFNLHITIWNLTTQQSMTVLKPKSHMASSFSNCGSYFAVATRNERKDSINVIRCNNNTNDSGLWESESNFNVPTLDLAALAWSPDNGSIVVQDSCLRHSILVYSPFGDCLAKYSAYTDALGVRCILFNKTGSFLAVGNYDQSVRMLNSLTWQENMELKHVHPKFLSPTDVITNQFALYDQCEYNEEEFMKLNTFENLVIDYVAVDETKLVPKIGISFMEFNFDGTLLVTKNENIPNMLWIWDVSIGVLVCVVKTIQPIRCIQWSPAESLLCFVIGSQYLHFWSPSLGCRSSSNIVSLVNLSSQQQLQIKSNVSKFDDDDDDAVAATNYSAAGAAADVNATSSSLISTLPSNTSLNLIHFTANGDSIHTISSDFSVVLPRSLADES